MHQAAAAASIPIADDAVVVPDMEEMEGDVNEFHSDNEDGW